MTMKSANLHSGTVRIQEALESLERAWEETSLYWDDSSSRNFDAEHIQPIGPKVRSALNAINHLRDIATRLQRDCEM